MVYHTFGQIHMFPPLRSQDLPLGISPFRASSQTPPDLQPPSSRAAAMSAAIFEAGGAMAAESHCLEEPDLATPWRTLNPGSCWQCGAPWKCQEALFRWNGDTDIDVTSRLGLLRDLGGWSNPIKWRYQMNQQFHGGLFAIMRAHGDIHKLLTVLTGGINQHRNNVNLRTMNSGWLIIAIIMVVPKKWKWFLKWHPN